MSESKSAMDSLADAQAKSKEVIQTDKPESCDSKPADDSQKPAGDNQKQAADNAAVPSVVPNGPITIIDAHRSMHQDSPLTGQLIQSISVLNRLLMAMVGGAQP